MLLQELFDRYNKVDKVKKGGQKIVYRVETDNCVLILKIICCANDPRVLQEIELTRKIELPFIPLIIESGTVFDPNQGEEVLYIVEEYINGSSLRDWLNSGNRCDLIKAFMMLQQLLIIECELEKISVLHRDINPNNIIIRSDGDICLIDFGLAKIIGNSTNLTKTGALYGPFTPGYAPHEQIANLRMQQDVRTDLFQIGVTIYESISGVNPFVDGANDLNDVMYKTMNYYAPVLTIAGDRNGFFYQFIGMLMAKQQSQRPDTAYKALEYLNAISDTLDLEE